MNKLISYFKQGKGRGLKAIFAFSAIIALLTWGLAHYSIKELPQNADLNAFIEQLPTIVIQDGIVTEPANANNVYTFSNQPIFYLQSDRDSVSPLSANGFYLTRKNFSIVSNGVIQRNFSLANTMTITPDLLIKIIRSIAFWVPVIWGLFYFVILSLFYLVVVGISALIAKICRFQLNKGAVWRSASFSTIVILLIDIIMSILGYSLGGGTYPMLVQLLITILLVLLILYGIRENNGEVKEQKKKK
ncbi:MAG: DUF1189 family protein [Alphaproteobacteria bacterium]|nr:DUF1189 family protein [Alphaproteobacteria bacterium]